MPLNNFKYLIKVLKYESINYFRIQSQELIAIISQLSVNTIKTNQFLALLRAYLRLNNILFELLSQVLYH